MTREAADQVRARRQRMESLARDNLMNERFLRPNEPRMNARPLTAPAKGRSAVR